MCLLTAAACASSSNDSSGSGTSPTNKAGASTSPPPSSSASGNTNNGASTEPGPTTHLFRDVRIDWVQGKNGLERNCNDACADKKMECRNGTTVRFSELGTQAVGMQVFEAFDRSDNYEKALDCVQNTSDGYNDHGKGYMPLRTDCTCYAETKLVKGAANGTTCAAICKGAGLTCDDTVYWPDASGSLLDQLNGGAGGDLATGGGRAHYGEDAGADVELSQTVSCNDVPKDLDLGVGRSGGAGLPPSSLDCACR